ncbi:MAG: PRC-barrel domain-containing protein [Syntrophobacteraceae bacterium]|nr:PRC-barrel domain-containing protein [Syntrophobacteraceae bacterium]
MMKSNIILPLLVVAGFLVASPLFAAQNRMNNPNQSSGQNLNQASMNFNDIHVKDLIGKKLKGQNGASIGTVSDVVIGKSGRVDFIVLSHGGVFSDKYTPVPYHMFISNATNLNKLRKDTSIATRLSKAQIDKAPTFSTRHFNMSNSQARVCSYFGPQQCSQM